MFFSFISFARFRLILFFENPSPVHLFYPTHYRPNDFNTEVRRGLSDVELVDADDEEDGVDSELPNDVDHRVRSEKCNPVNSRNR